MAYKNTRYKFGFGYTPPKTQSAGSTGFGATQIGDTSHFSTAAPSTQTVSPPTAPPPVDTLNPYADPNFLFGAAGIEQGKQLAQGAYDYGTGTRGPQEFGYTYDPATGNVVLQNSSAYGYNPFNQAAQLQRSYDNSRRGTTNSYAAQGQLYSGALQNAQDANSYNFNKSSDQLQRSAGDYYHGLQTNLDAASGGKYTQAILDSLNSFLKNQQGS